MPLGAALSFFGERIAPLLLRPCCCVLVCGPTRDLATWDLLLLVLLLCKMYDMVVLVSWM